MKFGAGKYKVTYIGGENLKYLNLIGFKLTVSTPKRDLVSSYTA